MDPSWDIGKLTHFTILAVDKIATVMIREKHTEHFEGYVYAIAMLNWPEGRLVMISHLSMGVFTGGIPHKNPTGFSGLKCILKYRGWFNIVVLERIWNMVPFNRPFEHMVLKWSKMVKIFELWDDFRGLMTSGWLTPPIFRKPNDQTGEA